MNAQSGIRKVENRALSAQSGIRKVENRALSAQSGIDKVGNRKKAHPRPFPKGRGLANNKNTITT